MTLVSIGSFAWPMLRSYPIMFVMQHSNHWLSSHRAKIVSEHLAKNSICCTVRGRHQSLSATVYSIWQPTN